MSETAKHDDIEDVLSSIRRLVSDSANSDRREPEPVADRLVLTPSLRVADTDGRIASVEPVPAAEAPEDGAADARAGAAPDGEVLAFAADETWPDRPVADMSDTAEADATDADLPDAGTDADPPDTDADTDTALPDADATEAGAETKTKAPGSLRSALKSAELPFGLSSFLGALDARDRRDVVMFRSAQDQADPQEPAAVQTENADAAETADWARADDAPLEGSEPDTVAPGFDAPEIVPGSVLESSPDMAQPAANDAGDEAGWPAPDSDMDAPMAEEPESWPLDAATNIDAAEAAPIHVQAPEDWGSAVSSDAGAPTPPETNTFPVGASTADEMSDEMSPAEAEMNPPEEVAAAHATPEDLEPEDITLEGSAPEEFEPQDLAPEDIAPDVPADIAPAPAEGPANASSPSPDHELVRAGLSNLTQSERGFEPEHGDTDWNDTETVQPALDIAAVRQARGEEITPNPDAVPQAMPVFARSRRRPMTSLDDLITPEAETVADAVSQALADGALDRADQDAAPAEAQPPMPSTLADDQFEAEPGPSDDLDMIDEEALRDLIAQVVREELQGALGQRITRNVRKMVRREIRLALAAEDFQ